MKRLFTTCLLTGMLSGCTVNYKAVGSFEDYDETFLGDLSHNLLAGRAQIHAVSKSGITCTGHSYATYVPPLSVGCAGQRGKAPMRCSDGRRMEIDWEASSCTAGSGEGRDQNGARFTFAFGIDEATAKLELGRMSDRNKDKPSLPVYKPKEVRKERGYSTGTGFYISDDGHLITNWHVIDGARTITVVNPKNGQALEGKVIRSDPTNDISLVKVEARSSPIPLARSFNLTKGEEIITLGYPLVSIQGQEQKATFGRINALSGIKDDVRFLQIDAPIQPGNSGGPLIDLRGDVVGVVTATLNQFVTLRSAGALPQNVNFAVKVDYVWPLLDSYTRDRILTPKTPKRANMEIPKIVIDREPSVVLIVAK